MKTKIIQIGNSQGIRIPKSVLEQADIPKNADVDLSVDSGKIVISPFRKPRQGWEDAFKKMHENGDDVLLDQESDVHSSSWDENEWEWT